MTWRNQHDKTEANTYMEAPKLQRSDWREIIHVMRAAYTARLSTMMRFKNGENRAERRAFKTAKRAFTRTKQTLGKLLAKNKWRHWTVDAKARR